MRKIVFLIFCILIIIASCSKKTRPTKEPPIDAAMVFSNNCARCHGADGATGRAPNLTKTTLSKPEIVETVTKGSGRMPEFQDKISEREIYAIADYVVGLKK